MHRLLWTLAALLLLVGCSQKNLGAMNKEEVEAFMKDRLKLTEISLTENPDGTFGGTGKKADGSKHSIEVTLDPKDQRIEWKVRDAKGNVSGGFVKHYR
jgi:hypothetical protein